jgi:hypothetical protein
MNLRKIFGAVGVFSAFFLGSSWAHAAYVCDVYYVPSSTTMGSDGLVVASFYSAPNCGGSLNSVRYFCSGTPTSTSCASSASYRYNTAKLMGLMTALQQAAINDEVVTDPTAACIGGAPGAPGCGTYVVFKSN